MCPVQPYTTRVFVSIGLVAGLLAGCSATDRAGAPRTPDTTRLTVATRTLGAGPAGAFAAEVERLSKGSISIDIESKAHRDQGRRSDAAILADVVSGDVALGAVSIEALQQAGVHSLDPLVAPGVLTSIDAEAAAAESATAAAMLAGTTAADVTGLAIVPGPIHYLASIGRPLAGEADLDGADFLVTATSSLATDTVERLGATVESDDRSDQLDTAVQALDVAPQTIGQRNAMDANGYLFGNVALWPQPVVIVGNPNVLAGLTDTQRAVLFEAGLAAVRAQSQLVADETEDGLAALCRGSNWKVLPADQQLVSAVGNALAEVTNHLAASSADDAVLAELQRIGEMAPPATHLSCDEAAGGSATPSTDTNSIPYVEVVGTWAADVTQEALDRVGTSPGEQGLLGHWELTFSSDGRLVLQGPLPQDRFNATVEIDGDTMTITVGTATAEQGQGEVWRFTWSVFNDSLTFTRAPAEGIQKGPTIFVSQQFTRT